MGEAAAQLLVKRIAKPHEAYPEEMTFEPELMVRESSGAAKIAVAKTRSETHEAKPPLKVARAKR
jgi:hypothetical protein